MITINHGLSAVVTSGVLLPLLERHAPVSRRTLTWAFFLGGMAPDADILAKLGGRAVYFSSSWYGHREASHSLLGALVLGVIVAALVMCFVRVPRDSRRGAWLWLTGAGWIGGLIHIFGDLFTPGMEMPVFWPLPYYFGGWRHIGWFSPYLLWLFVTTLLITSSLGWMARLRSDWGNWCRWAVWAVCLVATWRWADFLIEARYQSNIQWVEFHRELLPDAMIDPLQEGVRRAWYWLTS